jgi:hypothetical protein
MNKQLTFLTRRSHTAQTETVILTEAQINQYNEQGYIIPEYRLSSETGSGDKGAACAFARGTSRIQ